MVHLLCAELQYLFQQVLHFPLPALPGAAQFLLLALCQLRECRGLVLLVLLFQLLPQLLALLSTRRENKAFGFLDIGVCYVRKIRNEGDVIGFEHRFDIPAWAVYRPYKKPPKHFSHSVLALIPFPLPARSVALANGKEGYWLSGSDSHKTKKNKQKKNYRGITMIISMTCDVESWAKSERLVYMAHSEVRIVASYQLACQQGKKAQK